MRVPSLSILFASVCLVSAADSQKRVPSGFTGVRGKKSVPESTYVGEQVVGFEEENKGAAEKRAPADFYEVRGKKPSEQWSAGDYGNKRAPSGFLGMRGKKEIDYEEYEKRAPNGFMGMRGKKEYDANYEPYYEKRAPSGFMGMRGKKESSLIEEDKRAPNSGFFGMRGKKQPGRSSFFGMRGKKFPYDLRGKFVGVRGKKLSGPTDEYLENLDANRSGVLEGLDFNQLMYLLTENEGYNPERETAFNGQDYSLN